MKYQTQSACERANGIAASSLFLLPVLVDNVIKQITYPLEFGSALRLILGNHRQYRAAFHAKVVQVFSPAQLPHYRAEYAEPRDRVERAPAEGPHGQPPATLGYVFRVADQPFRERARVLLLRHGERGSEAEQGRASGHGGQEGRFGAGRVQVGD